MRRVLHRGAITSPRRGGLWRRRLRRLEARERRRMISAHELRDRFEFFVLRRECDPHSEAAEVAAYWCALDALDDLLAERM